MTLKMFESRERPCAGRAYVRSGLVRLGWGKVGI